MKRALLFVVLLVAAICAFAVPPVYRMYRATEDLTLDGVSAVTIQPNGDWPIITLDTPDEVSSFINWLGTTRDTTRLRSAPPPIVFDGEIRFHDGSTEPFRTSAVMEPLTDTEGMDDDTRGALNLRYPRGDVLIDLPDRSLTRSGERRPLADLVKHAMNGA